MKIAIISDVHGNLEALKKVYFKIKTCNMILSLGDLTGYYPDANEVIDFFRDKKIISILGNHDHYILEGQLPVKEKNSIKTKPFEFIQKTITLKNLSYLRNLKQQKIIEIDQIKIGFYHGSPSNLEEYIYQDTGLDQFKDLPFDFVFLGHTHRPMMRKVGKMIIVNPGSVGQPRDEDKRASFAILDTKERKVTIQRTAYNSSDLRHKIKKLNFNQQLIDILK